AAGAVPVTRKPRRRVRHRAQRVEADADLAERAARVAGAPPLRVDRVASARGRDLDDAPAAEAEAKAVDGPSIPLRRWKCDDALDRKSTRLNSSHVKISYAVFCL